MAIGSTAPWADQGNKVYSRERRTISAPVIDPDATSTLIAITSRSGRATTRPELHPGLAAVAPRRGASATQPAGPAGSGDGALDALRRVAARQRRAGLSHTRLKRLSARRPPSPVVGLDAFAADALRSRAT